METNMDPDIELVKKVESYIDGLLHKSHLLIAYKITNTSFIYGMIEQLSETRQTLYEAESIAKEIWQVATAIECRLKIEEMARALDAYYVQLIFGDTDNDGDVLIPQ